ncbi:C10 family peptidase [Pedobacter duraquae]|uniref:Peptidase C10-like protein n=1 Tax=Pedobacter duraquae TaxID=425511 RepID=A0A4R6ILH7_9SPHI|nr:C10 family peptidase [Pedobacter duraquae]TDO22911.1 peptidase C10-like protein [Pedobacter duraquae]
MNTKSKIAIAITLFSGVSYVVGATSFPGIDTGTKADHILIKTHWKQMGGFEMYTPDHLRLGCWSTALAQIMFYHQLKPFGAVDYTSRHGYVIKEQIDSNTIVLGNLVPEFNLATTEAEKVATAKYNYFAALAVAKDFGTDSYMHKLAPASLLEAHYNVSVKRYISWHGILPFGTGKLKKVICEELNAGRPLFLHFANLKDFGHSVVIDGYQWKDNQLMVHLNQGQGGAQDGWYKFDAAILKDRDDALRVVYAIRPIKNGR